MSRSGANSVPDETPNHQQNFQHLVKKWDELKNDPAHFDPTELLCDMAGILEKVNKRKVALPFDGKFNHFSGPRSLSDQRSGPVRGASSLQDQSGMSLRIDFEVFLQKGVSRGGDFHKLHAGKLLHKARTGNFVYYF